MELAEIFRFAPPAEVIIARVLRNLVRAYQDADEFKAWWDKDSEMLAAAIRRMGKAPAK